MVSAHFGRERRLTDRSEFDALFAHSSRSSDRYFTVLCATNERGTARLGLTVSRRTARRAVDRNRIKRHTRECFRQLKLGAADFVVMARPPAVAAGATDLRRSLERHFNRLDRPTPASPETGRA